MTVDAQGWLSWCVKDPGPAWKQNWGINGGKGIIPHSAEGYRPAMLNILHGSSRDSWHFSVFKEKEVYQHYPITAQCWTSGSGFPNNNFKTGETEGVAGQPWTQFQIDSWVRIGRDLRRFEGWTARRPINSDDKTASCYEHRECVRFGSPATACPSGRNRWDILIPAINAPFEDEPMTAQEKLEFEALKRQVQELGAYVLRDAIKINKLNEHITHPPPK